MQKGKSGSWAQAKLLWQRDRAAAVVSGVPERAREACVHPGNGGIAGDVGDLEAPSLVLGELQHCVDVDTVRGGIDGPDVIAGSKESG